MQLVFLG